MKTISEIIMFLPKDENDITLCKKTSIYLFEKETHYLNDSIGVRITGHYKKAKYNQLKTNTIENFKNKYNIIIKLVTDEGVKIEKVKRKRNTMLAYRPYTTLCEF